LRRLTLRSSRSKVTQDCVGMYCVSDDRSQPGSATTTSLGRGAAGGRVADDLVGTGPDPAGWWREAPHPAVARATTRATHVIRARTAKLLERRHERLPVHSGKSTRRPQPAISVASERSSRRPIGRARPSSRSRRAISCETFRLPAVLRTRSAELGFLEDLLSHDRTGEARLLGGEGEDVPDD